jgi:hypothetical protein
MTKQEILDVIKNTWDKYGSVDNPSLTTYELSSIDSFIDDIERLISDET